MKADYQKMRQKLAINWEEYLGESKDDIDKMWTKFVRKYEKADIECVRRSAVVKRVEHISIIVLVNI